MIRKIVLALLALMATGLLIAAEIHLNTLNQEEKAEDRRVLFDGGFFDGWRGRKSDTSCGRQLFLEAGIQRNRHGNDHASRCDV
jgi:hypothetical protein